MGRVCLGHYPSAVARFVAWRLECLGTRLDTSWDVAPSHSTQAGATSRRDPFPSPYAAANSPGKRRAEKVGKQRQDKCSLRPFGLQEQGLEVGPAAQHVQQGVVL